MVSAEHATDAHPALAKLFKYHGKGGVIQSHATIFFRQSDAEKTHLGHLVHQLGRINVLVVVLVGDGLDVAFDELPHHSDYLISGFSRCDVYHFMNLLFLIKFVIYFKIDFRLRAS